MANHISSPRPRPPKRRMPRFRQRCKVTYGALGLDRTHRAFTADIGPGGLSISTNRLLDIGSSVQVEVVLDDGTPLVVEGEVRWARRAPRGLEGLQSGSFGVSLIAAPPEWYTYMSQLAA